MKPSKMKPSKMKPSKKMKYIYIIFHSFFINCKNKRVFFKIFLRIKKSKSPPLMKFATFCFFYRNSKNKKVAIFSNVYDKKKKSENYFFLRSSKK